MRAAPPASYLLVGSPHHSDYPSFRPVWTGKFGLEAGFLVLKLSDLVQSPVLLIGFARKIDRLRQYGSQKTVRLAYSPSTYRGPTPDAWVLKAKISWAA